MESGSSAARKGSQGGHLRRLRSGRVRKDFGELPRSAATGSTGRPRPGTHQFKAGGNSMSDPDPQRRLLEAESKLCQALHRLHALRRAALYGNYDPAEFDRAVLAYRQAESDVKQARAEFVRVPAPPPPPPPSWPQQQMPAATETQEGRFEPTARMHFYRWLVQHGRLTDWSRQIF